jgi:hypothetical protein
MSTIPIEVSTEQLLSAVRRLPPDELAAFAAQVNALRAQQQAPRLDQDETALLLKINAGLPPQTQTRLDELIAKRETETIAPDELQELIAITEDVERHDADRLEALSSLALIRRTTIPALMTALGLSPHPRV